MAYHKRLPVENLRSELGIALSSQSRVNCCGRTSYSVSRWSGAKSAGGNLGNDKTLGSDRGNSSEGSGELCVFYIVRYGNQM